MNIKSTIAQWRSFLLQGKQVTPQKSMVLGMNLRFRPPLKHPPATQFEIQIRDSRIQMTTRSNSFPSITNLADASVNRLSVNRDTQPSARGTLLFLGHFEGLLYLS